MSDYIAAAENEALIWHEILVGTQAVVPASVLSANLGLSKDAIAAAVSSHRMYALPVQGENYYPGYLLDLTLDKLSLERVCVVLGELAPWSQWHFWTAKNAALEGRTPLDSIRAGQVEQVLTSARGYAER